MKYKKMYEFESHKLEKEIDLAMNGEWTDEVWISPQGKVLQISKSLQDLFRAQNPNLSKWTLVIR